jgi:NADH:ubiquinone oxidoreductase subunit 6 (subunit J)
MKVAGLFLLFAGFVLVSSALVLLPPNAPRGAFVLAGIAVQILGLVLTFRAHLSPDEGR